MECVEAVSRSCIKKYDRPTGLGMADVCFGGSVAWHMKCVILTLTEMRETLKRTELRQEYCL